MDELPDNWSATETENVWYSHDDGRHAFWLKLPDGRRLEVFLNPSKRPGLRARVLSEEESTDAQLDEYLAQHMNGWRLHACRLDVPPGQVFDNLL